MILKNTIYSHKTYIIAVCVVVGGEAKLLLVYSTRPHTKQLNLKILPLIVIV